MAGKYDAAVNRESAYEILNQRTLQREAAQAESEAEAVQPQGKPAGPDAEEKSGFLNDLLWGSGRRQGMVQTLAKQAARTVGSQLGRQILRGLLGGILGGKSR